MWQKSRAIWKYINFHYKDDYDWFILGGDDIFLIVENLRKVGWRQASVAPCGVAVVYVCRAKPFTPPHSTPLHPSPTQ